MGTVAKNIVLTKHRQNSIKLDPLLGRSELLTQLGLGSIRPLGAQGFFEATRLHAGEFQGRRTQNEEPD